MKFIIANWKMNGNMSDKTEMLINLQKIKTDNKIVLCLPFTLLNGEKSGVFIGAQDVSQYENGAHTGDISAQMLKDSGAEYVIVGHSERRINHKETNDIVRQKSEIAIKYGLMPIICVGENLQEYESGQTIKSVIEMLEASIPESGKFIVAYEPYWAIGTNKTPTKTEISNILAEIHKKLIELGYKNMPVIYGGSVNPLNSEEIMSIENLDGVLVGGASLKIDTFLPIINSAN